MKNSLNFYRFDLLELKAGGRIIRPETHFRIASQTSFPMDSPNNLEIKGSLQSNPLAELIAEIAGNKFSGALRLLSGEQKNVVYFDAGEVIFAVSNAREHRLYELLLQAERITKDQLLTIPNFTNDLALKKSLLENNLLDKAEINRFFSRQISEILKTAIAWNAGEWTFSPLVRARGDIRFSVDWQNMLIDYARRFSAAEAARRLENPKGTFSVKSEMPEGVNLVPAEYFVYSRFDGSPLTAAAVQSACGLPDAQTFQILYALWLGGFLVRQDWSAAFSGKTAAAIRSAKLMAKKEEPKPVLQPPPVRPETSVVSEDKTEETAQEAAPKEEISLDEYLARIEGAKNYYEVFALPPDSAVAEIKQSYFALAKRFHPDLFHKESNAALLQRIQNAFSEIARGYETLKSATSREVYDFRRRKELAEIIERQQAETPVEEVDLQAQTDQAAVNFEQGFNYVMDDRYEAAVPFLARAVHYAPQNARYRAYYGKALSSDKKQRHRAESELRAAVKFDPENADYRMMLAEFFVSVGLPKRAEGELNRLLAIFPANREAQAMLEDFKKK